MRADRPRKTIYDYIDRLEFKQQYTTLSTVGTTYLLKEGERVTGVYSDYTTAKQALERLLK